MSVNGTVPWGAVNVPFNVYDAAVKAGQKYMIDPALLLAIGNFESGYRTDARNENPPVEASYGWLQFNRLAGNGSRQTDPNFSIEALFDPYHSADLAAKNIRGQLDRGATVYDAVSPWSVRDKAFAFLNGQPGIMATIPSAKPSVSSGPTVAAAAPPVAAATATPFTGTGFAFPELKLGSVFGQDFKVDTSPLFKIGITLGAVVLLFVGVVKLTSIDDVAGKVV